MNRHYLSHYTPLFSQLKIVDLFHKRDIVDNILPLSNDLDLYISNVTGDSLSQQVMGLDESLNIDAYKTVLAGKPGYQLSSDHLYAVTKEVIRVGKDRKSMYGNSPDMLNKILSSQFNASVSHIIDAQLRDLTDERKDQARQAAEEAQRQYNMNHEPQQG